MWTKGYLTGGLHLATPDEWDALYRLEGARRRWKLYRGYYQQASARYFGPPPYIVTVRHVLPNPEYAALRGQMAEINRQWAERQAEYEKERLARVAAKRARQQALLDRMADKWAAVGGRNRWIARERWRGRIYADIAAEADLSKERVRQICAAQQRKARKWKAPRGRVFDPDPLYPRDVWITWTPETDPNDIPVAA